MNKKILVFFSISLFLLISCKSDDPAQPAEQNGSISGIVTNTSNDLPVANASILTNPSTKVVTTDQTGAYSIPEIIAGTYILTITKDGYKEKIDTVKVESGKTTISNIQLIINGVAPDIPILNLPEDSATDQTTSPTLNWTESNEAASYNLQVSRNDSFTDLVFDQNVGNVISKKITGLYNSTDYWWRVSAINIFGTSEWSARKFTTKNLSPGSPCPGLAIITDPRDNKVYNTVLIGDQCWLRENLNIGSMINSSENQQNGNGIEKYCYDNDEASCNTYGGLYQWNEAMQYTTGEMVQGICPPNWHIPSKAEFATLKSAVVSNGNSLKEIGQGTANGAGTNTSGFSALLAGDLGINGVGVFGHISSITHFWDSTELVPDNAYYMVMIDTGKGIYFDYNFKYCGFSVRCVKD
ncbi:MAG: FISUMP domain-containing protein [bacterium]